ncbi:ScbA/BarX family gamma-butyrolactone biosynthesis protein [Streptomyces sp. NPDC056144]|uniref:ScbA/BarX family gamma-butyrolactone biosynthesis protein n=1 Tax=unclassified Streptomyces TaxID=2593676 RepID=UPI0035DCB836
MTHVPGQFVHRADPSDIIPTGWTRRAENRFSVSARWPAGHPFFSPVAGGHRHDPLLVAETVRQATMLVVHAELGVPVEDHFVMWDLHYTVDPDALAVDGLPHEVTADVTITALGKGRGANLRTDVVLTRGGRPLGIGGGTLHRSSALAYRRIRGAQLAVLGRPVPLIRGVAPGLVGRRRPCDVVLGPGPGPGPDPGQWRLRIDTGHSTLFRRPNDHVPGMVLLEAARQAAVITVGGGEPFVPTGMAIAFQRYAELDVPCWIEAESAPRAQVGTGTGMGTGAGTASAEGPRAMTSVRISGRQNGEYVFLCTLTGPAAGTRAAGAVLADRVAS